MSQQTIKTPAMVLYEFARKHNRSIPFYHLVGEAVRSHQNGFYCRVFVGDVSATGFGRSIQVAKHAAAIKALDLLAQKGLYDPSSNPTQEFHRTSRVGMNFVGILRERSLEFNLGHPIYAEISAVGPPHCCEFTYECNVSSITTQSTANTKQEAKQLAAKIMLDKIGDSCPEDLEPLTANVYEAIKWYSEFTGTPTLIPGEDISAPDFPGILKKRMAEKNISYEDFDQLLQNRSKDGLGHICNALEVHYKSGMITKNPPLVFAMLELKTPVCCMVGGSTKESAEHNVINKIFSTLETFLNAIADSEEDY